MRYGCGKDALVVVIVHLALGSRARQAQLDYIRQKLAGIRHKIILGDFNLTPPQLATVTTAADRTTGTGSTVNSSGDVTSNLYDHLLVHDETASTEIVGNARVLDVREVTTTNQLFFQTVSDHLPIVVQVRVAGPDDD